MAYPLIIFGAGASHDCIRKEYEGLVMEHQGKFYRRSEYEPPLTAELFKNEFDKHIEKYKYVTDLASEIPETVDFETFLTRVQNEYASRREDRYKELVEMRFYLAELFQKITAVYYYKINNYKAILGKIRDNKNGLFINFNYDLLFERNIESIFNGKTVDSYIADEEIKVIKIHGAYNWAHIIKHLPSNSSNNDVVLGIAKDIHIELNDEKQQQQIWLADNQKEEMTAVSEHGERLYPITVPAIAIPITEKKNYVCPESHVKLLKASLPEIDRVLLIGWKAGDKFIVDLINKELSGKNIPLGIVSPSSGGEIAKKFPGFDHKFYEKGFTQFINDDDFTDFMK